MSSWMQMYMQDALSPMMMSLLSFHDLVLTVMVLVLSTISYMMIFLMTNKYSNNKLKEAHKLELIWTLIPTIILI